jgi:hypothetical protein
MKRPRLAASDSNTSNLSGLFSLPRELRDIIWEYVITDGRTIPIFQEIYDPCREDLSPYQPALCRVSRQIRSESLPLFYSRNTFLVRLTRFHYERRSADGKHFNAAAQWIKSIGDPNLQSLQTLEFEVSYKAQDHYNINSHLNRWQLLRLRLDVKSGQILIRSPLLPVRQPYRPLYNLVREIAKFWTVRKPSRNGAPTTSQLVRFMASVYELEFSYMNVEYLLR